MIEAKGRSKRNAVVVTELPYQVNKSALLQRMAEMVNDKKVGAGCWVGCGLGGGCSVGKHFIFLWNASSSLLCVQLCCSTTLREARSPTHARDVRYTPSRPFHALHPVTPVTSVIRYTE